MCSTREAGREMEQERIKTISSSHPVVRVHDDFDLQNLSAFEGIQNGPVDVRRAVLIGALGSILKR